MAFLFEVLGEGYTLEATVTVSCIFHHSHLKNITINLQFCNSYLHSLLKAKYMNLAQP